MKRRRAFLGSFTQVPLFIHLPIDLLILRYRQYWLKLHIFESQSPNPSTSVSDKLHNLSVL